MPSKEVFSMLRSKAMRIFVGIAVPLVLISGVLTLYFFKSPLVCTIHELTGIHCPGCGTGRALTAIVHFRFFTALRCNAPIVLLLPLLGWYSFCGYMSYVFGVKNLPRFDVKPWMAYMIIAVIAVYCILRNIPVFPFTLLAPPEIVF